MNLVVCTCWPHCLGNCRWFHAVANVFWADGLPVLTPWKPGMIFCLYIDDVNPHACPLTSLEAVKQGNMDGCTLMVHLTGSHLLPNYICTMGLNFLVLSLLFLVQNKWIILCHAHTERFRLRPQPTARAVVKSVLAWCGSNMSSPGEISGLVCCPVILPQRDQVEDLTILLIYSLCIVFNLFQMLT